MNILWIPHTRNWRVYVIVRSSESVPAGVDNMTVSLSRILSNLAIGFVGMLGIFGSIGDGVEVLLDILLDVRFGLDILPTMF